MYTDGSCIGNPGPGGWAFIVIKTGEKEPVYKKSGSELETTNNRMEMIALLEAAKYIAKNFPDESVEINSDSNLLVQTINQGWKKKANQDLWVEIDKSLQKINFKIFWVKAHADDEYNNLCDELAFAKAQKAQKEFKNKPWLKKGKEQQKLPAHDESEQASMF